MEFGTFVIASLIITYVLWYFGFFKHQPSTGYDHIIECLDIPRFSSSLVGIDIQERLVQCSSREQAYSLAKVKSLGRNPLLHERPHRDGQQSHYHPHKHLYAVENGRFINYHYCFGPSKYEDGRVISPQ